VSACHRPSFGSQLFIVPRNAAPTFQGFRSPAIILFELGHSNTNSTVLRPVFVIRRPSSADWSGVSSLSSIHNDRESESTDSDSRTEAPGGHQVILVDQQVVDFTGRRPMATHEHDDAPPDAGYWRFRGNRLGRGLCRRVRRGSRVIPTPCRRAIRSVVGHLRLHAAVVEVGPVGLEVGGQLLGAGRPRTSTSPTPTRFGSTSRVASPSTVNSYLRDVIRVN
jgi:hypothetical protein